METVTHWKSGETSTSVMLTMPHSGGQERSAGARIRRTDVAIIEGRRDTRGVYIVASFE